MSYAGVNRTICSIPVGPKDAAIMAANRGHGPNESTTVPEPDILVLSAGVTVALVVRRRFR